MIRVNELSKIPEREFVLGLEGHEKGTVGDNAQGQLQFVTEMGLKTDANISTTTLKFDFFYSSE